MYRHSYFCTSSINKEELSSDVAAILVKIRELQGNLRAKPRKMVTGMMLSGIDFDRPDRLRVFPFDRFWFFTIAPIVSDRPDRTQFYPDDRDRPDRPGRLRSSAIVREVFPYDRPDRLNIFWDDWDDRDDPDDHMETRL